MFLTELTGHEHNPKEYRMPDRDKIDGPKLTLPIGLIITFTRRVDRVGYEVDKYSFTKDEWAAKGLEIVCRDTGLQPEIVNRVITSLSLYNPYKGLKSQIYRELMHSHQPSPGNEGIRAMWFVDFDDRRRGIIEYRVRRWTGQYYPASGISTWDYDNYEPAFLSGRNQNLYQVGDCLSGLSWLIYPDDVEASDAAT